MSTKTIKPFSTYQLTISDVPNSLNRKILAWRLENGITSASEAARLAFESLVANVSEESLQNWDAYFAEYEKENALIEQEKEDAKTAGVKLGTWRDLDVETRAFKLNLAKKANAKEPAQSQYTITPATTLNKPKKGRSRNA